MLLNQILIMKTIFLFVILLGNVILLSGQSPNPKYDAALADSLGADDYGMKNYVFVILKTGPARITDQQVLDSLFRGHLRNIERLVNEGKIIVAGPFGKNDKTYRGLFVFDVATVEEVETILQTDPTIRAGIFETEIYPWYGSAALGMYLPYSERVEKVSIVD